MRYVKYPYYNWRVFSTYHYHSLNCHSDEGQNPFGNIQVSLSFIVDSSLRWNDSKKKVIRVIKIVSPLVVH